MLELPEDSDFRATGFRGRGHLPRSGSMVRTRVRGAADGNEPGDRSGTSRARRGVSGMRTKRAVVTKALQASIVRRPWRKVVDLMAELERDDSLDDKAERSRN